MGQSIALLQSYSFNYSTGYEHGITPNLDCNIFQIISDKVFEETGYSQFCSIKVLSLKDVSEPRKQEIIHGAGVSSIKGVGRWMTETLHVQFKEVNISKTLKNQFELLVNYLIIFSILLSIVII